MSELPTRLLIKSVTLVDPASPHHLHIQDVLIDEGIVSQIATSIDDDEAFVVDASGQYLSGGWCDIGAYSGEPGDEVHETMYSLTRAARKGGYTCVGLFSNDVRPFDNRHIIADIVSQAQDGVQLLPIPAITKALEGKELAEMLDLERVAVPLFTDGMYSRYDNSLLYKAMEYVRQCDGRLLTIPGAHRALKQGQVNESAVSAQMGIPGIPGFEEVARLAGELSLVSYTGCQLFVHLLSHRDAVDQVRFRQQQGLSVMASVSASHLLHTEQDVLQFDENYKILPPLRSEDDRKALIQGLRDEVIQMVCSNHIPISSEQKEKEFGESPFGAIGLETTFLSLVTAIEDIQPEEVAQWMSSGPRAALGLSPVHIAEGQQANFTLYSLKDETNWSADSALSLSKNSPYRDYSFSGRVIGSVFNKNLFINS